MILNTGRKEMSIGGPRKWINKEMFSVDTPTFLAIELKYANFNFLLHFSIRS